MSTEKKQENPYNKLVMRLSSLRRFPLYPAGVRELRETLQRRSGGLEIAERVIDRVVADVEFCPSPRELARVCDEELALVEAVPEGCTICSGHPFVAVEFTVWEFPQAPAGKRGIEYRSSGARRCDCARGRFLRDGDRKRALDESAKAYGLRQ